MDDSSRSSMTVAAPAEMPPSNGHTLLDWSDDPANAKNWCFPKRMYNTLIPACLCLTISFGLAAYSPARVEVQHEFNVTSTVSILPFSLYVYGLAFGPMISAPLSETYGRRFIYVYITPISLLFIVGAGFAKNIATLIICRFFAGAIGSSPLAVGAGTIMDIWHAFLGPALGSLVVSWIAEYKDWQWSQWETYSHPLIRRRAKAIGLPVPPSPIPSGLAGIQQLLTVTLTRPLYMLATEPIVCLCSLYTAFNFCVLFTFLTAFPLIFQNVYSFSSGQTGLVFLSIAIGCVAGAVLYIIIDHRVHKRKGDVYSDPEQRLWGAMYGSILMPAALFWFAWTARPGVHWMASIVAAGLFGCSNLLIFVSCVLYLTNVYGARYGASALAANGVLRYMLGGSLPLFVLPMYHNLGFSWAGSLLGFLATGFAPIPLIFYNFGPKIRRSSPYTLQKGVL
ncbi:major facilitator superfamily domain-containing protein [Fusarium redolens]|uniref:Major facilitator superfamily domain-containing protein n=1 Tax=Fusarium redolens TaxID=48865 RepID=A0A9P9FVN1_FUSRE|nr:major facilitator superfamily domain-containing protein [Fusarium redolens]KAH7205377.1 major facilitator superfamily domain-containing protein [Fusarium redolens]